MKSDHIIPDDADRLMTTAEVGERLGTGSEFVRTLIRLKLISALKFGRNSRIRKKTLDKFLEKHDGEDLFKVVEEAERHAAG